MNQSGLPRSVWKVINLFQCILSSLLIDELGEAT